MSRYWRHTYPVVSDGDDSAYLQLEMLLETLDPTAPDTIERLRKLVDLDNFLEYTAAQIWFANYDWPGNCQQYRYDPIAGQRLTGRRRLGNKGHPT